MEGGTTTRVRGRPISLLTHNLRVILRLLRDRGSVTPDEAARLTGLDAPTARRLMLRLAADGYLLKEGGALRFNARRACVVSIHIDEESLNGVLYDLAGSILCKLHVSTEWNPAYETTIDAIAVMVLRLIGMGGISHEALCGIAVSCDGVVDARRGVAMNPLHHAWPRNRRIRDDLLACLPFHADIFVENACRLLAYAEIAGTALRDEGCVVTIFSEYSTGGAVLRDGRPLHGRNGLIGEVGHVVLDPESDALCTCGAYGCFEALVSPPSVWRLARDLEPHFPDAPLASRDDVAGMLELFRRNEEGDPLARAVMDVVAGYFAQIVYTIGMLHDPDRIILQGLYSKAGEVFLNTIREKVRSHPFYAELGDPPVAYSSLDFSRPDVSHFFGLGGAHLVADRFLAQYSPSS